MLFLYLVTRNFCLYDLVVSTISERKSKFPLQSLFQIFANHCLCTKGSILLLVPFIYVLLSLSKRRLLSLLLLLSLLYKVNKLSQEASSFLKRKKSWLKRTETTPKIFLIYIVASSNSIQWISRTTAIESFCLSEDLVWAISKHFVQ